MAKQPTIERSENYGYYSDLLWCAVPLTGMAWYYYGLRPVLLMLDKLKEWVMLDIYLVGIGVASIKVQDYAFLQERGVAAIYGPGTPMLDSVRDVLNLISQHHD